MKKRLFGAVFLSVLFFSAAMDAQACEFPSTGNAPLLVAGGEGAMLPILNLNLAGQYPFVVFTPGQDEKELAAFLGMARGGRMALADSGFDGLGTELKRHGTGGEAYPGRLPDPVYLFYQGEAGRGEGAESAPRRFSVTEEGEFSVRVLVEGTHGNRAGILLDGSEPVLTRESSGDAVCLSGKVVLQKGEHTFEAYGGKDFQAAFLREKSQGEAPLPEIRFRKIDPTRYVALVSGADAPFTLVFSVSYNRNWKAFIREDGVAGEPRSALYAAWVERRGKAEAGPHLKVNGYANGWVIDPPSGSFQVVIEYVPQRRVEAGLVLSASIFAISGVALLIRRKRE